MKVMKTNTIKYLQQLETAIKTSDKNFVYVKPSKYSKFKDYILNYKHIHKFVMFNEIFKKYRYAHYTQYNLNPFDIHPQTYNKLKSIQNDFVLYYTIFENAVSEKIWKYAESNINEVLRDSSSDWVSFGDSVMSNMEFKMVHHCIGVYTINPTKRINTRPKPKPILWEWVSDTDWSELGTYTSTATQTTTTTTTTYDTYEDTGGTDNG